MSDYIDELIAEAMKRLEKEEQARRRAIAQEERDRELRSRDRQKAN
mgnify:CR=1 FL=1